MTGDREKAIEKVLVTSSIYVLPVTQDFAAHHRVQGVQSISHSFSYQVIASRRHRSVRKPFLGVSPHIYSEGRATVQLQPAYTSSLTSPLPNTKRLKLILHIKAFTLAQIREPKVNRPPLLREQVGCYRRTRCLQYPDSLSDACCGLYPS